MNPLKLYGSIAIIALLLLTVFAINKWDNNRLKAAFNEGVQTERVLWVTAAADAKDKAIEEGNTNTLISERTADQARITAEVITAASAAANQSIVEKINHAYAIAPPAPCVGSKPAPLPSGVLEGLSEARSAALGQAPTTSRGLHPTQRK